MDQPLQNRIKMQEEAKAALRNAAYNGSILVTVGGGKGKIMIDTALELIQKYNIKRILYLCDSTRLRDSETEGFPGEIAKWGTPELDAMITRKCYQTTYKWKDEEYDLVLADEVDVAISPALVKVFLNNKFRFKVLVTGTLAPKKKDTLQRIAPIVYQFSTSDAEDQNIVNKSHYFVYNYRMTEDESNTYRNYNRKISALIADSDSPAMSEEMKYVVMGRKHFLNALDSSCMHTRKVLQFLYNKQKGFRPIVFCELTKQADRVCKYSYHGGNEKLDNLLKYQNGEIDAIAVVSKIKRGINLKNANVGVYESLSSSSTEFEQRNGRLKRLPMSEVAIVIFMVPWYRTNKKDDSGNWIWKPTIIDTYVTKATKNLRNFDLKTLKL